MNVTKKRLAILGSTGSIGVQSLEVAQLLDLPVVALTANRQVDTLERQARQFKPQVVAMMDPAAAKELKIRLADTGIPVLSGMEGLLEIARRDTAGTASRGWSSRLTAGHSQWLPQDGLRPTPWVPDAG